MKRAWRISFLSWALVAAGCSDGEPAAPASGDAATSDAGAVEAADGAIEDATARDAAAPDASPDAPASSEAKRLLRALGDSVWHGAGTRRSKTRGLELRFRASSLQWAEVQNPYGPGRKRELRSFTVATDGETVNAVANTPLEWPDRSGVTGPAAYSVRVVEGTPRKLEVTKGSVTETFEEGPFPRPTRGLTASVRAFPSGQVSDAFCTSGANGFDYGTFLDFARGRAGTALAEDTVAGAKLLAWVDPTNQNRFSVTDVDGFDGARTDLSDTFDFFVRYTGAIAFPAGGSFRMRERDDVVADGVWAFLGRNVGSRSTADLFLEVHGFVFADKTPDVPQTTLPSGNVPIEIIVARCAKQISPVHVEISLNGGSFALVGDVPSVPAIDDTLFPPPL